MMRFSASAIMTLPETLSSAVLIRRLLTASNFCAVMSARILDDLEGSAVAVQDRVVRGLQPDLPAALADAPVLTRIVFAAPELGPECAIVAAVAIPGLDEQAVVLAFDLIERIADGAQEQLIRAADRPIQCELDHGLRLGYCRDLAAKIVELQGVNRGLSAFAALCRLFANPSSHASRPWNLSWGLRTARCGHR